MTHHLIAGPPIDREVSDDDRAVTVECDGVTATCRAWRECLPCTDKAAADDDYADTLDEDGEAHGVEHQRVDGVWMTPTEHCVACALEWAQSRDEIADGLPAGRYEVDVDCDDGFVYFKVLTKEQA